MEQKKCTTNKQPPINPDAKDAPGPINPETGQHTQYWVLCEEELAKGFVRPVRNSYIHRGKRLRGELEMLDTPDHSSVTGKTYVAIDRFVLADGSRAGTYLTQKDVDQIKKTGYYGGCGVVTTMGRALSETYARDPKFYSSTFCCGCGAHFPVGQFVWDDDQDDQTVVGE